MAEIKETTNMVNARQNGKTEVAQIVCQYTGCSNASKHLGRQAYCLTINRNLEIDQENSCPFDDCQYVEKDNEKEVGNE